MKFNSITEIKAHTFVGNYNSDEAAFTAIEAFAADTNNPLKDRADALRHMGEAGMGLSPEETGSATPDDAMIAEFVEEYDPR